MKRLQYWIAGTLFWVVLLDNVERLHEPINIASFVYPYTALCALAVILLPALRRLPLGWLLILPLLPFLVAKVWLGYPLVGPALPLTVTEACAIEVTMLLARGVALALAEWHEALSESLVGDLSRLSRPFVVGQGEIYREIRRARMHQRPLTMLAVSPGEESVGPAANRLAEQVRRENLQRWITARLAGLVTEQARETDIVTERDGHLVTLLTETSAEDAQRFANRLAATAEERLGVTVRVGLASFPDQEVTFERLLERAEAEMHAASSHREGPEAAAPGGRVNGGDAPRVRRSDRSRTSNGGDARFDTP